MADRVCLLKDGRVQQYAPPQEVFDRPANRFVAEFVGNPPMNVVDVALDAERAGVVIAGSHVPLGDRYQACAAAGVSHVGVRARDLELVPAGTPGTASGSVYVVEPLGDEVSVEVLLGEARVSVRAPRGWTADPGSPIGVRMDPARACFFTPDGTTAVHRSSQDSPISQEVEGILS
jgi:multiple sugar transport system ATP-binding protein